MTIRFILFSSHIILYIRIMCHAILITMKFHEVVSLGDVWRWIWTLTAAPLEV